MDLTTRIQYKKADTSCICFSLLYPALTGSKTPTSKFSESKEFRWGM